MKTLEFSFEIYWSLGSLGRHDAVLKLFWRLFEATGGGGQATEVGFKRGGELNPLWHGGGGYFFPLSFLYWILLAELLSKHSKRFWRWKLTCYFDTLIEFYQKLPLGGAKDEHFSFFQRSCQRGLSSFHDHSKLHIWKIHWFTYLKLTFYVFFWIPF